MTDTFKKQTFKYTSHKSTFLPIVFITIQYFVNDNLELYYRYAFFILLATSTSWYLFLFILGFTKNRNIILTKASITTPKSLASRKIITINYADIISLKKLGWLNSYSFEIIHKNGKLRINANGFKSNQTIDIIHNHLIMQRQ